MFTSGSQLIMQVYAPDEDGKSQVNEVEYIALPTRQSEDSEES